jgi:hypothetical protein
MERLLLSFLALVTLPTMGTYSAPKGCRACRHTLYPLG